ncbi:MAG: AAA family ATPase [Candidatus Woesearchaeota archaeon]
MKLSLNNMLIKRVKLHNIRTYSDEEFIFPEGSILLSGDIGSGKSSVLLAIEFAFFGATNEISPGSLLRKGKNQGFVEIDFEVEGKEFTIKRTLKKSSDKTIQTSGYFIADNIKNELTPSEMKNEIIRILGYPLSLASKKKSLIYRFTVYTPQEQMKQILFEKRDERLNTIRKLFGIDRYKTIMENSEIILLYLREKINEESVRSENLEQKKEELREISAKKSELEKNQRSVEEEISAVLNKLEYAARAYNAVKEDYNKFLELKKEIEILNSKIEEKQNQFSAYKHKLEEFDNEINEIKDKIKDFRVKENKEELKLKIARKDEEIERIKNEMLSSQKDVESLNKKLSELKSEIKNKCFLEKDREMKSKSIKEKKEFVSKEKEFLNRKKEVEERLNFVRNSIANKMAMLSNLKNTIEALKNSKKCPLCLQELTEAYKERILSENRNAMMKMESEILELEKSEKELREEFDAISSSIQNVSEQKIELVKEMEQIKKIEEEILAISEKEKMVERIEAELQKLRIETKAKEELNSKMIELQKMKKDLELLNEFEKFSALMVEKEKEKNKILKQIMEIESEIKKHQEKAMDIKKELKNLENVEKVLKEKEGEVESIKSEQKNLEIRKAALSKELALTDEQFRRIEEEIKKILEAKERLNRLKSFKYWIEEHFSNVVMLMEKHVMSTLHNEFNELFKEWFNMLMGDETITARLDEDFTPIVEQNNYEIEIESLSGGEKTSLALAYRLALNKVINDITHGIKTKDLIILDEPTDGFSSQQLDKVRDVIKALNMKQVIIVSHEQKIESFVDKIIRIEKDNGVSRIIS